MSVITIGKCGSGSGSCKPKQSASKKAMKKKATGGIKSIAIKAKKQPY